MKFYFPLLYFIIFSFLFVSQTTISQSNKLNLSSKGNKLKLYKLSKSKSQLRLKSRQRLIRLLRKIRIARQKGLKVRLSKKDSIFLLGALNKNKIKNLKKRKNKKSKKSYSKKINNQTSFNSKASQVSITPYKAPSRPILKLPVSSNKNAMPSKINKKFGSPISISNIKSITPSSSKVQNKRLLDINRDFNSDKSYDNVPLVNVISDVGIDNDSRIDAISDKAVDTSKNTELVPALESIPTPPPIIGLTSKNKSKENLVNNSDFTYKQEDKPIDSTHIKTKPKKMKGSASEDLKNYLLKRRGSMIDDESGSVSSDYEEVSPGNNTSQSSNSVSIPIDEDQNSSRQNLLKSITQHDSSKLKRSEKENNLPIKTKNKSEEKSIFGSLLSTINNFIRVSENTQGEELNQASEEWD